jgi:hypothetical protein
MTEMRGRRAGFEIRTGALLGAVLLIFDMMRILGVLGWAG